MWPVSPLLFGERHGKGKGNEEERFIGSGGHLPVRGSLKFLAGSAFATNTYWKNVPATPGDWFEPANWNNGVPDSANGAI